MDEAKNLIFIAWSKERSKTMALAVRDWLRHVVPASRPWCSPADIDAGTVWDDELQVALHKSVYGILCVTSDNYMSPWLNYECGELSNRLGRAVCPLLLDASPNDLQPTPLSRRQAKRVLDREEMLQVVFAVNNAIDRPTPDDVIKHAFSHNWPTLETSLNQIPTAVPTPAPKPRETGDKLDELLTLVQSLTKSAGRSEVSDLLTQAVGTFGAASKFNADSRLAEAWKKGLLNTAPGRTTKLERVLSALDKKMTAIEGPPPNDETDDDDDEKSGGS